MMMNKTSQNSADYDDLREICQIKCLHTTYEFHHWLIEKSYLIVRPEQKSEVIENELGNEK
ncbi:MAG: hypothetical protein J5U17_08870 [Candidatus Methanoperedens sp.]|nr:hypothetical protein [Candidatus Methanoperedens sp.]MCE8429486.1 hypothetical protein [Candidatus Methanoperedens sp.]